MNGTFDRRAFDRRLFFTASIIFPLIILIGFARTYYLKSFFGTPPLSAMLVHLHGLLMSAWVGLFVTQVWLISSRRVKTHQRLGYAAIGLAALVIVVGFLTAVRAAKFGSSSTPGGVPRLAFLIVPLTDLVMFALLFGAAIYFRKQSAEHKRLMLLTAVNFLPPALARIPIPSLQAFGPLWFFGFPITLALIALAVDWWKNKKVNKVFLIGILLLLASMILRLVFMGTETWMRTAEWLTSWAA